MTEISIVATYIPVLFGERTQERLLCNMALHMQSTFSVLEMNSLTVNPQMTPLKRVMECSDGYVVVQQGQIKSLHIVKKNIAINFKIQFFCSLMYTINTKHIY